MFSLPNFSVRRPVCILICVLSLVVFGVAAVVGMPIESTPEISMPVLLVITSYPGASPDEMDQLVTDRVEAAMSGVTDIKTISSSSSEGRSFVMMQFDYGADIDKKHQSVSSALGMIRLPDDATTPTIIEMNMSSLNNSIMSISISTQGNDNIISYVEDNVVPEIKRIGGVADVTVSGGARKYIRVLLDENKLTQYKLTMQNVASAIGSAEYTFTLGQVDRGNTTLSLVGSAEYNNHRALENIPITLSSGDIIYVSDVATVTMAKEDRTSYSRQNGQENINISVTKEQSANTIQICQQIVSLVDDLNQSNLGLNMEIVSNSGQQIMDNIESVIYSLLLGLVVAAAVLIFFFGEWKSSLIVGLSMPLSVFAALVLMSSFGMTINLMSLGGLVVGIGMMVDNAIVVMESCFRARSEGRDFVDSVAVGANLVTSAIVASTITTIVVFLPISIMQGMSGQLFKDVGFTIVFAMLASLISALTLVPLLFVRMKPNEKMDSLSNRMLEKIDTAYHSLLQKALGARKTVVAIAIGCFIVSVVLFAGANMELMPSMNSGDINLTIETKNGLNLESTNEIMTRIEALVAAEPEVESYSLRVGGGGGMMGRFGGGGAGSLSIKLKGSRTTQEVDAFVQQLRDKTTEIDNCLVSVSKQASFSFGNSDAVEIKLKGNNLSQLGEIAETARAELAAMPEFHTVTTSLSDGSPRAKIVVDPILAGSVRMTPASVLSAAMGKISGLTAMKLQEDDTEYTVKVQYPKERYQNISDLAGLMIDTPGGGQVALTDIAEIVYEVAPSTIAREDRDYVVTVTATPPAGSNINALTNQAMRRLNNLQLPDTVSFAQGVDMRMMVEEFTAIGYAMLTAVFLVFAVMAIQFESLTFSGVVMLAIPFSLTGAFLGLRVSGSSLSMPTMIGLIMLVGIVVNNAIVLIDYANTLRREEGMDIRAALIKACRTRLRPILMSTLTTIVALVPMAIGIGGRVEMMQGMAWVVIGGLTVSTLLTLVLIPTFYVIFDKDERKQRKFERKERRGRKKKPGDTWEDTQWTTT